MFSRNLSSDEVCSVNKMKLVPLLIRIHHMTINNRNVANGDRAYYQFSPQEQVEYCFEWLIFDGFVNYVHHWTPTLKNNTIKYWFQLITSH